MSRASYITIVCAIITSACGLYFFLHSDIMTNRNKGDILIVQNTTELENQKNAKADRARFLADLELIMAKLNIPVPKR